MLSTVPDRREGVVQTLEGERDARSKEGKLKGVWLRRSWKCPSSGQSKCLPKEEKREGGYKRGNMYEGVTFVRRLGGLRNDASFTGVQRKTRATIEPGKEKCTLRNVRPGEGDVDDPFLNRETGSLVGNGAEGAGLKP